MFEIKVTIVKTQTNFNLAQPSQNTNFDFCSCSYFNLGVLLEVVRENIFVQQDVLGHF